MFCFVLLWRNVHCIPLVYELQIILKCYNSIDSHKYTSDYINNNMAAGNSRFSSIVVCLLFIDNEQVLSILVYMLLDVVVQVRLNIC